MSFGGNNGHGHVWERPDGVKARCGGPGVCRECSTDLASAISSGYIALTITETGRRALADHNEAYMQYKRDFL